MTISGTTRVLGLFGDPVAHSLSPLLHARFTEQAETDSVYVPFQVTPEDLEQALFALPALNILGVNITVPHKESVFHLLSEHSQIAQTIGAVNTVINQNGQLIGDNTDAFGFLSDIRALFSSLPWEDSSVVVIGAGGAARAVVHALASTNVRKIIIANRTRQKAEELAAEMAPERAEASSLTPEELGPYLDRMGLLVNTTNLGLKGETIPGVDLDRAPAEAAIYDLIYNPPRTPLLEYAASRGLPSANGLGMLVRQGAKSFELWTGHTPEAEPVIEWLKDRLCSTFKQEGSNGGE